MILIDFLLGCACGAVSVIAILCAVGHPDDTEGEREENGQ